jgi:hypothetical protein
MDKLCDPMKDIAVYTLAVKTISGLNGNPAGAGK